jgi:hypothetical protein
MGSRLSGQFYKYLIHLREREGVKDPLHARRDMFIG